MLIKTIEVSPFLTNCYLVVSEVSRRAMVIDPGDEVDMIIKTAHNEDITIEKIINTHGHIDHTAGVKELQERLGIPFYIHEADSKYLKTIQEQARMFGMKTLGMPAVDGYLHEGDVITCDEISLSVIHTPGHSPGGVCFLAEKAVFAGDTLFMGSIGRADLPGGNDDELLNSIKTKLLTLDDTVTVYSGHGPSTTIGREKRTNPFLTFF